VLKRRNVDTKMAFNGELELYGWRNVSSNVGIQFVWLIRSAGVCECPAPSHTSINPDIREVALEVLVVVVNIVGVVISHHSLCPSMPTTYVSRGNQSGENKGDRRI
jgi:hypothetical protein